MPEVGDGDDDQQVESHREQSDAGQEAVDELRVREQRPPAGGVDPGKAEFSLLQGLHVQRGRRRC